MGGQIKKHALKNVHYLIFIFFFSPKAGSAEKIRNRISDLEVNTAKIGTELEDPERVSAFMEINVAEKRSLEM